MRPETIAEYHRLLEGAVTSADFYSKVLSLSIADPYAFELYLELAECLQIKGLMDERRSLLEFACKKGEHLLSTTELLSAASTHWTKREGQAFVDIIGLTKEARGELPSSLLTMRARGLVSRLRPEPSKAPQNLVLIQKIDAIAALQEEVASNELAWVINTARQESIAVHKDTNAIILRNLQNSGEDFVAVDGPHESARVPVAQLFPRTIEVIERFAKEMKGGLGRVALVRLKPHSRVFRHYDGEVWLKGRNRYHLVIKSGGSVMNSGPETTIFHEGDLFLFNNKVMHTAENRSDDWRIHVIFDMKVLNDAGQ